MKSSLIIDSCLDRCDFTQSDLRDLTYNKYPAFEGHNESVTSIAFSADGNYLASGSDDKTVKLWNVESQLEVVTLEGHSNNVTSVAFSPDGRYLASGSDDKTIKLWSIQSLSEFCTLQGHNASIYSIAFSV
jgi:WD40 repeat protein